MTAPLTPMASLRWAIVRPLLKQLNPSDVFEVGCGQGGFGSRIAAMTNYTGVEPDEQSYRVARERIEPLGGTVRHGLSDLIPAEPAFDLVCAFEVLEHVEHDTESLRDWMTRLRPGGSVLVSVPAWPDRFSKMDELVGHYRRYRPEDIDRVLRDAGCVDVRHYLYGWPLGYALEAVRVRIAERRGAVSEDGGAGMAERSATSGRLFQPKKAAGTVVRIGAAPFAALQKARPNTGVGLVAIGRRPAA
jgi:SAM-dependent methyltransferase